MASLKQALKVRALPHRDLLGWVGAARCVDRNSDDDDDDHADLDADDNGRDLGWVGAARFVLW